MRIPKHLFFLILAILAAFLLRAQTVCKARERQCRAPVIVPAFLTPQECRAVIDAATKRGLERSEVGGNDDSRVSKVRTSHQVFLEHDVPAVDAVIRKAETYLGVSRRHFEELQVVRYDATQKYEAHFDSDEDTPFDERRSDTLLVYLTDVDKGGETEFPELGLQVTPEIGKAVHWKNVDSDGNILPCAFHGGKPVRKGTKWICTVWCHLH